MALEPWRLPELDESGDDKLKYIFTPGPFTKMLKKAVNDPYNYYYLVIEELNRGNAPAIFGEIFQLLDRKEEDEFPTEEVGESEYGISNYEISKEVYEDIKHPVRIPSNMYILATMNTADQNVFTLDTAFQRRWNMRQIENRFDKSEHSKDIIAGTKVNWGAFATVINDMVIEINVDMASSEDKRLGTYFVKKKELEADRFPEKVLKYLWDDAFKMDKTAIFNDNCKSLEDVVLTYETATTDKLATVLRLSVYENFPMGYHISEDDKELRKDIILLFATLAANTERRESELLVQGRSFDEVEFPLQSYMYLIKDFYERGYYREQEISYKAAKTGKINWSRTIKTQKPYVQDMDVFYLDFVIKKNSIKENELITLIHEYCVYESFECIGWLFTKMKLKKPRIARRERVFRSVLREKMANTCNDRNRMLFRHMLAIIDFEGDNDTDRNYRYGTYRFEYVWEKMIDKVFGIPDKADYFPKTAWYLNGDRYDNASLEPDTIMLYGSNIYILDAKYYKYGVTGKAYDLPESVSVNKQITYGEYVAHEEN